MPCHGDVTQPAMTPRKIATSHFSSRRNGPMLSKWARANSRAGAVSRSSGRTARRRNPGITVKLIKPGTMEPAIQRPQVRSTCPIWRANSAIRGLAAMPVRNMAEAT